MRRGYSKFLTITLILIVIAVIGLLGYLGYDYYTKIRTTQDAAKAVEEVQREAVSDNPTVVDNQTNSTNSNTSSNNGEISSEDITTTDNSTTSSSTSKGTSKKLYKNGFYMIATIEIPKTNAKYPILEKVTKKSLETSVAVIWPENPNFSKAGNIVIVGHNYRNGVFFSDNKKISKGDNIYISDLNGNRIAYKVYKTFQTSENDTSFYNRETNGKREITLSTCTDDSSGRLIVQARAE